MILTLGFAFAFWTLLAPCILLLYFEIDGSWKFCTKTLRLNKNVNDPKKNGAKKWINKIKNRTKIIREI
jgi:hypothetical protein